LKPDCTRDSTKIVHSQPQDLRRVIGLFGSTALIVGITIGSGIFRTPPTIAGLVPNPLVIMGLWTAFGLISICGALAVAELSTLLPRWSRRALERAQPELAHVGVAFTGRAVLRAPRAPCAPRCRE
jgi:hypothetical protein